MTDDHPADAEDSPADAEDRPEDADDRPADADETDEDVSKLVERLHDRLRATEERPVERSASRWVGEAQAVAGDAAMGDIEEGVVRERVGHVRDLLANVEETGDETADEHVDAARRLAKRITEEQ